MCHGDAEGQAWTLNGNVDCPIYCLLCHTRGLLFQLSPEPGLWPVIESYPLSLELALMRDGSKNHVAMSNEG